MLTTLDLLHAALQQRSAAEWSRELKLNRNALNNARQRGQVSPAIAYALAEEMGLDADTWGLLAAAEGEKASTCADRMKKRLAARLGALKDIGGNGGIRTLDEALHPILP